MPRHEQAAAALRALAAAGIPEICLTWQTDWVLDLNSWTGPIGAALDRLPGLLAEDDGADERYLIFRAPSRDVVVFDDCNDDTMARLRPYAFLVVRTSPGNCHVWLRLDRPEAAWALFRQLEPSGANGYSFNGGRLPGFINRKRHRRESDGGHPMTELLDAVPGRLARVTDLAAAGLLASGWESEPPGPRPIVPPDSLPARSLAAGATTLTRRARLICRWSVVTGREYGLPTGSVGRHLTTTEFERQLDGLARHRRPARLSDLVSDRPPRQAAALVFDQTRRSFQTAVLPVLTRRGWPATLFISLPKLPPYHSLGPATDWNESHDFQFLGLHDLLGLRERGVDLGVLIANPYWRDTAGEIRGQLERGLRLLGPGPVPLALGHDQYRPEAVAMARDMGYACAVRGGLSGLNGPGTDPFALEAAHGGDWHHRDPALFPETASGLRHLAWRLRGRKTAIG